MQVCPHSQADTEGKLRASSPPKVDKLQIRFKFGLNQWKERGYVALQVHHQNLATYRLDRLQIMLKSD